MISTPWSDNGRNTASLPFNSRLAFSVGIHVTLLAGVSPAKRERAMSRVFQCKKRDAIWTRVIFNLECFSCKNMYVSGAATAPRKVVSNSYQTYRTTLGMKWTNFRLSLLWMYCIVFHLIRSFLCNRAILRSSSLQMNYEHMTNTMTMQLKR